MMWTRVLLAAADVNDCWPRSTVNSCLMVVLFLFEDEIFYCILLDCICLLASCRCLQCRFEFVAVADSRLAVLWLQAYHNEKSCGDLNSIGVYSVDCLLHELWKLMRWLHVLRLFGYLIQFVLFKKNNKNYF